MIESTRSPRFTWHKASGALEAASYFLAVRGPDANQVTLAVIWNWKHYPLSCGCAGDALFEWRNDASIASVGGRHIEGPLECGLNGDEGHNERGEACYGYAGKFWVTKVFVLGGVSRLSKLLETDPWGNYPSLPPESEHAASMMSADLGVLTSIHRTAREAKVYLEDNHVSPAMHSYQAASTDGVA